MPEGMLGQERLGPQVLHVLGALFLVEGLLVVDPRPATTVRDVVGSLCENNDKFAIDRELPEIDKGDLLVVHDTGAHGHAMGFQYNGKLRSSELLLKEDGSVEEIRRAETLEDYFATLDFSRFSN